MKEEKPCILDLEYHKGLYDPNRIFSLQEVALSGCFSGLLLLEASFALGPKYSIQWYRCHNPCEILESEGVQQCY